MTKSAGCMSLANGDPLYLDPCTGLPCGSVCKRAKGYMLGVDLTETCGCSGRAGRAPVA